MGSLILSEFFLASKIRTRPSCFEVDIVLRLILCQENLWHFNVGGTKRPDVLLVTDQSPVVRFLNRRFPGIPDLMEVTLWVMIYDF